MPDDGSPSTDEGRLFPITTKPGIKRDGTVLDGENWTAGQHTRFQRGRAKKMGGWRSISPYFDGPIRKILVDDNETSARIWAGSGSALQFTDVSQDGIGSSIVNVTPTIASGFVPSGDNTWQFAQLFDATSNSSRILAHAAPNLANIGSRSDRKIWFGDINGSVPLVDTTAPEVSGGILAVSPYAVAFGNYGIVQWCVPNLPDDWAGAGSGTARVTEKKIVYGQDIRGGSGQSPAFMLWSLNRLLRATFNGGSTVFDFDTISKTTVLSSSSFIESDGVIYWIGIDRFNAYNGVVQKLPNEMNNNYFFDNLNWTHRQKVWGMPIEKFGELWWFYPRGNSTECNAAIIFNKDLNVWYDTMLERSAGYPAEVFRWPIMADVRQSTSVLIRPAGGTPGTDQGGIAANAFDDNPATDCAQISPDGAISYDYGEGTLKTIVRVGIMSATDQTYDLVFESTLDGVTWTSFLEPGSQAYGAGEAVYNVLNTNAVISARALRVREQGGAVLDLAEVYFEGYGFLIHQHEFGVDRIIANEITSIRASIEGADISYVTTSPLGDQWIGQDQGVKLLRIEPDLVQVGDMRISVITRNFAKGAEGEVPYTMTEEEEYLSDLGQGRQMRLRFTSDTPNGYFELGEFLLKLAPGDQNFG